jgi:transketolase
VTMRDRFYDVVTAALAANDRLVVVLADIGAGRLPDSARIVNVGIREQLMVGVASGLALEGYRPLIHSYAPFLVQRPYEQLKLDLGHQGVGAVLVSVGASYDASTEGRTHQAPEDVALLAALPGWVIHVPGHPDEMEHQLQSAITGSGNVYIRLEERSNRRPHQSGGRVMPIVSGPPGAPAVLAVGTMLDPVLEAMEGQRVTVAYTNTVRPLDGDGLRRVVGNQPDVVVVEPYLEGSSHHAVGMALSDRPKRLLSVGFRLRESRRYGSPSRHELDHGLDAASMRTRIAAFLGQAAGV